MRANKAKFRLFRTDRGREMTVDFMTGIGLFCMVALFAGVHEAPALPAPLAKTEAALADAQHESDYLKQVAMVRMASITTPAAAPAHTASIAAADTAAAESEDRTMLLIMALVFASLSAITIQFWRHLRREYASPRRKWGRG